LALLSQCCQCSGCSVHGRVGDGEHGHHYNGIHHRVEARDTGVFDGDDEGGGFGVDAIAGDELWTGVRYGESNDGDRDNVELRHELVKLCAEDEGSFTIAIRQNTCLIAVGKDLLGLCVSAAARPTSSVPPNAKAAVTRILQKPLKPLLKAPGSAQ
jgi:hypothetical protein